MEKPLEGAWTTPHLKGDNGCKADIHSFAKGGYAGAFFGTHLAAAHNHDMEIAPAWGDELHEMTEIHIGSRNPGTVGIEKTARGFEDPHMIRADEPTAEKSDELPTSKSLLKSAAKIHYPSTKAIGTKNTL